METYHVDEKGYYGTFGGAYIPEMLYPNVEELRRNYLDIMNTASFKKEFDQLLRDYVGRPSPLYYAQRLSQKYKTKVYLKREDLNHTGAHKVNNTIGQILMAKRLGKTRIIAETGAGQHGVATATVCAYGDAMYRIYGRGGCGPAGAKCSQNENVGGGSAAGKIRKPHLEGRYQ